MKNYTFLIFPLFVFINHVKFIIVKYWHNELSPSLVIYLLNELIII